MKKNYKVIYKDYGTNKIDTVNIENTTEEDIKENFLVGKIIDITELMFEEDGN